MKLQCRYLPLGRYLPFGLVWVAACATLGCGSSGPAVEAVRGKVLVNGAPLPTGSITTLPAAGRGAHGYIESDGSFALSTFGDGDGAVPGMHKVGVTAFENTGGGPEAAAGKALAPQRYANPESSGLTIDVVAGGDNSPVLELTSP